MSHGVEIISYLTCAFFLDFRALLEHYVFPTEPAIILLALSPKWSDNGDSSHNQKIIPNILGG